MIDEFAEHRQLLFGLAYRMLGQVADAEDMVQETWLRWQRQERENIQSPKAWLVSTVSRLCIDQLRSARRQRQEYYGVWLPEPLSQSDAPAADQSAAVADSLSMAFMTMLEALSPVERAAFLLHEVFDYEYADISKIVDKSEINCRKLVSRAKTHLAAHSHAGQTPTNRARHLAEKFIHATTNGVKEDFISLLTEDAVLLSDGGGRVRAAKRPIETRERVIKFWTGIRKHYPTGVEYRCIPLNGRPSILMSYAGQIFNAISFDIAEDRIRAIYVVRNPEKLARLAKSILSAAN
jgi:RNA polymerase sigma-70 factor (ECF subfamily)